MNKSTDWDARNLAHRYTVSFFKSQYGDDPAFVTATKSRMNQDLLYFNVADADNEINAAICAGLLVSYMQAQGIPHHAQRTRGDCFNDLATHLKVAEAIVLTTADIVDHYFRFFNETDFDE